MAYDTKNNVIINLSAAVASGVTQIAIDPLKADLLENGPQNTIATIEEVDANGVITLREGVLITNRALNILTVVRAYQEMPINDSGVVQQQTSFDFDPVNGARLGLYWTKAHADQLATFLTKQEYVDVDYIGGSSVTGTDSYQFNSSLVTAYEDRQRFFLRLDVANNGSATVEINSLGAKPLLKLGGDPLATGDLVGDMTIIVEYNTIFDAFMILSTLADYGSSIEVDNLRKSFILGQDMTAGDNLGASFIGSGTSVYGNVGGVTLALGNTLANDERYLWINNNDSINLAEYTLKIRTVGAPLDDVIVTYRNTYGVVLDETIPAGSMTGVYTTFTFSKYNTHKFQGNKILAITRSGAIDPINYYEIESLAGGGAVAGSYSLPGPILANSSGAWVELGRFSVTQSGLFDISFEIRNDGTVVQRDPQLQVLIGNTVIFDQTYIGNNYGGADFILQTFTFNAEMVSNQDVRVRSRQTHPSMNTLAIRFQNYTVNGGVVEDKPTTAALTGYKENEMFLSDNINQETNIANGVLVSSGSRGDSRQFIMSGLIGNSANTPNSDLFLNGNSGEYGSNKTGTEGFFQIARQMETTTAYVNGSSNLSSKDGEKQIVLTFGSGTTNFYTAGTGTFTSAGIFIFPGSDTVNIPKSIKAICQMNAAGESGELRVIDNNSGLVIAQKLTGDIGTSGATTIIDLGEISNISTSPAQRSFEGREITGSDLNIYSLIITY